MGYHKQKDGVHHMNKRIDYFDKVKGILIILVVVAHVFQSGYVHDFIYMFHMPAFFIISGMLLNHSSLLDKPISAVVKSRALSIGVPFLFFEVYGCISYIIRFGAHQSLFGFLYNTATGHFNNGVNWFLFALFFGELLFFIALKITKRNKMVLGIIACLVFVVSLLEFGNSVILHTLRRILLCFTFLYIGFLLESVFIASDKTGAICSFLILVLLPLFFPPNSLSSGEIQNVFSLICGSLCGTYFLLQISKKLPDIPFVFLGQNTITIYGTHNLLYILLGQFLGITDFHESPLLKGLIVILLVIILEIPIIYIINRYVPFLVGKKPKKTPQSIS